jgi:hypothetical protein
LEIFIRWVRLAKLVISKCRWDWNSWARTRGRGLSATVKVVIVVVVVSGSGSMHRSVGIGRVIFEFVI